VRQPVSERVGRPGEPDVQAIIGLFLFVAAGCIQLPGGGGNVSVKIHAIPPYMNRERRPFLEKKAVPNCRIQKHCCRRKAVQEIVMNTRYATLLLAAGLSAASPMLVQAGEAEDMKAMEAAAERVKKGADDFRAELQRIREERKRLQEEQKRIHVQQEAERRREADDEREQARKDAAALALAKQEKERQALAAAQEKARKEAAARAAEAERKRQAALAEQRDKEQRIARAQAALEALKSQGASVGYEDANATAPTAHAAQEQELTAQERAIKAMQEAKAQSGPRGME
jgi:chromosome segregation ATPase